MNPCVNGECELTGSGFRCHCNPGYYGARCESCKYINCYKLVNEASNKSFRFV